jgi:hypothetical protein
VPARRRHSEGLPVPLRVGYGFLTAMHRFELDGIATEDAATLNQRTGFASVLWSSCLAMLAVGVNSTAIMAALPNMRTELSLSSAGVEWAVNAYLVVVIAGQGIGICSDVLVSRSVVRHPGEDLRCEAARIRLLPGPYARLSTPNRSSCAVAGTDQRC